jgi:hypothetical protein
MSEQLCSTCRHWQRREDFYRDARTPLLTGRCAGIAHVAESTDESIAAVQDSEDHNAWLYTAATFSCALWAPK